MSTTEPRPQRLVVLLSGRGSHFENLHQCVHLNVAIDAEIVGVISDRTEAPGLAKAKHLGVASASVARGDHPSREHFEQALIERINHWRPDWVILAGFMRVLSPTALAPFQGRMLNIHPSLLPKYKGLHTHQKALDAGDAEHGASVHFVTPELDGGPILSQVSMPIHDTDDASSLAQRLLPLEHHLMQATVALLAQHDVVYHHDGIAIDGHRLAKPLVLDRDFDIHGRWHRLC